MAVYLIKDIKKDAESHLGQRLEFANSELEQARQFLDKHKDQLHLKIEHGTGYFGPNDEYIGLKSTHQVQLANVDGDLLQRILQILQPEYFVSDENPEPHPVSELSN